MRDGRLEASGHNWVEGQGSGARIDKKDGEEDVQYDALGNKIDNKKSKKLNSSELRKVRLGVNLVSEFLFADRFTFTAEEGTHGTQKKRRGGHG